MEITSLRQEAITQTYYDVENLIYDIVWRFQKRYGGEFEELFGEANLIFIKVYETYKEAKAAFSTWLCFCIWKGLLDKLKIDRRYEGVSICYDEYYEEPITFSSFSITDLLDSVSEDSKTIIKLICNPPKILQEQTLKKGTLPRNFRSTLRQYLQEEMEWTKETIRDSFIEIRRVIND